jgi:sec-independent protein translocase protein TatB
MFGIDFSEILVIFGIALVVLGPEKLPRVAATVGRWIGRARHMARQFREQLEQEAETLNRAVELREQEAKAAKSAAAAPPMTAAAPPPPAATEAEAAPAATPHLPEDLGAVIAPSTSEFTTHVPSSDVVDPDSSPIQNHPAAPPVEAHERGQ